MIQCLTALFQESKKFYQKEIAVESQYYKVEFTFEPKGIVALKSVWFNDPCRQSDSTFYCSKYISKEPARGEYKTCTCECDGDHSKTEADPRCNIRDYCKSVGPTVCDKAGGKEACKNEQELLTYRCTGCKDGPDGKSEWDLNNKR